MRALLNRGSAVHGVARASPPADVTPRPHGAGGPDNDDAPSFSAQCRTRPIYAAVRIVRQPLPNERCRSWFGLCGSWAVDCEWLAAPPMQPFWRDRLRLGRRPAPSSPRNARKALSRRLAAISSQRHSAVNFKAFSRTAGQCWQVVLRTLRSQTEHWPRGGRTILSNYALNLATIRPS